MMSSRPFYRALVCIVIATGLACDDPLGPEDVAGTYVLRTLRGEALPTVIWESETTVGRLVADTLRLNADGTGIEISHREITGDLGTRSERSESELQFEIRDDRIEGAYICRGLCLGVIIPIRGELTRDGLRLEVGRHGPGPIDFVRVD
ncbi:MAG: hypothetical protein ACT4PJ_04080 [Gemmatimonadaceae bacterium]